MNDSYVVTTNLLSTNVSIIFYIEDETGKVSKFTKTISNILETASHDDIFAAAAAVAKLYKHDKFDVKLVTTNLLEDEILETVEEEEEF